MKVIRVLGSVIPALLIASFIYCLIFQGGDMNAPLFGLGDYFFQFLGLPGRFFSLNDPSIKWYGHIILIFGGVIGSFLVLCSVISFVALLNWFCKEDDEIRKEAKKNEH